MPYRVDRNEAQGFIETVYTGVPTKEEIDEATEKALALTTDEQHLFLADLTDARPDLSALDIYAIPAHWEAAQPSRRNRLAVIVSDSTAPPQDSKFYENVMRNRGWNVRVFRERRSAIDWLTGA